MISVIFTLCCFRISALSTDEIIRNLVAAEDQGLVSEKDSQFISSFIDDYNESMRNIGIHTRGISFFKDSRIFDCFKYAVLVRSLSEKLEGKSCSRKCKDFLLFLMGERTEREQRLYEAYCPEFYRFGLLK